jgi:hypothetical protein
MAGESALEPEVRVLQPLQPLCEYGTDLQPADAQLGARRHHVALEELLDVPGYVQRVCSACAVVPCACTDRAPRTKGVVRVARTYAAGIVVPDAKRCAMRCAACDALCMRCGAMPCDAMPCGAVRCGAVARAPRTAAAAGVRCSRPSCAAR